MDIVEAVNRRRSTRAFKPDAVPQAILKEIMELALRAPSWANTQPWEFAIVTGSKLEEIRQAYIDKIQEVPAPDIAGPREFPRPYISRIGTLMSTEQKIMGIRRRDREGRGWWRLLGLRHYGAPSVIYIYIDRSLYFQGEGINAWPIFDCGSVAENIMLLATKYGLGTVVQAQAVTYPEILRKVLGIPDSKLIVVGIAIGYPDLDSPINQFRSEREPLDKVTKWYGFD